MLDSRPKLRKSREIALALAFSTPVVALETAVLTHGLPKGRALEIYREMCAAVREHGALPAPVGVFGGEVVVGLSDEEIVQLACDHRAGKAAIPDLAPLAARGASGGTTAGATLFAARAAGVVVVATGGIGGVHRGVAETFDISGDLVALARLGGCLVTSGAKSLCDLPKTWELLETLGITVVGMATSILPAFTAIDSGISLRHRVEDACGAAAILKTARSLDLPQTLLIANPPPLELALSDEDHAALEHAVKSAGGLAGPGVTPAILAAHAEVTGGRSVEANRALLINNAGLAAKIAVELAA